MWNLNFIIIDGKLFLSINYTLSNLNSTNFNIILFIWYLIFFIESKLFLYFYSN